MSDLESLKQAVTNYTKAVVADIQASTTKEEAIRHRNKAMGVFKEIHKVLWSNPDTTPHPYSQALDKK